MFHSRDSNELVPTTVPQGYETLGKVLQSTMWIDSQLRLLERCKTCKRVTALRTSLAAMQEDDNLHNLVISRDEHCMLLSDVSREMQGLINTQNLELANLRQELNTLERESREARDLDPDGNTTALSSMPYKFVGFVVVWTLVVMITTMAIFHHS